MSRQRILILTGHDMRCAPRGSVHFIADELAKQADVRVFTPGISELLRLKGVFPKQTRMLSYNKVFKHEKLESYVWRTPIHPFNPRRRFLEPVSKMAFEIYRRAAPDILQEWANWADIIIVESGLPVLFMETLHDANPGARLVYFCADGLETIRCDPYLSECLERAAPWTDYACILSPLMETCIPKGVRCVWVPQGIDASITDIAGENPYSGGINMVSVGAMLFDPSFFDVAAHAFPHVNFHVIGSGVSQKALPSQVNWYPTMPFKELPRYFKFADAGIAPYRNSADVEYLRDTSLKLIQYGLFGLPAICPHFAAADYDRRFGYEPGNPDSICQAIQSALDCQSRAPIPAASWHDTAMRMISPEKFSDTSVERSTEVAQKITG